MRFIDEAIVTVKAGDGGTVSPVFAEKNTSLAVVLTAVMAAKAVTFMSSLTTIPTP